MTRLKRMLAIILCATMVFASGEVVMAKQTEDVLISKVSSLGIMVGTDKGFEGEKTLTRAEAAAIMVRMKGISESAIKSAEGITKFKDVKANHWATGYINTASSLGIINGVGKDLFAPEQTVTIAEVETMAIRAIGAGALVEAEGTWPTNYVNFANEEEISKDVYSAYNLGASRIDTAKIILNTIEAKMWERSRVNTNKEITYAKGDKTILYNVFGIVEVDENKCASISTYEKTFNGIDVIGKVDLTKIRKGLVYDVWFNEDNEVVTLWETESENYSKVNFTSIVKSGEKEITLLVDGKNKVYKVKDTTEYYLNENKQDSRLLKDDMIFGIAYVKGTDLISIYAEKYNCFAIVDEVNTKTVKINKTHTATTNAANISFTKEGVECFLEKDGKAIDFTDLEKGDAIAYYLNDKKYVGIVLTETVEGKVKSMTSSKHEVTINGKKYVDATNSLAIDNEIVAYLYNGKIVVYTTLDKSVNSDVAVITSIREIRSSYTNENNKKEITITKLDGTETTDIFDEEHSDIKDIILGQVARFSNSKNGIKVVTKDEEENLRNGAEYTLTYSDKNGYRIRTANNARYSVDEDTIIYLIKDGEHNYEKELVSIDVKAIKENSSFTATTYVDDDDYAEAIIISSSIEYELSEEIAFVESVANGTDNTYIYHLLLADDELEVESDTKFDINNHTFVNYAISNDKLVALSYINGVKTVNAEVKEDELNDKLFIEGQYPLNKLKFADDCFAIEKIDENEFQVGDFDEIEKEDTIVKYCLDEIDKIMVVVYINK